MGFNLDFSNDIVIPTCATRTFPGYGPNDLIPPIRQLRRKIEEKSNCSPDVGSPTDVVQSAGRWMARTAEESGCRRYRRPETPVILGRSARLRHPPPVAARPGRIVRPGHPER